MAQLTSALGRTEQRSRVEGVARSSALRDVTVGLWSVQDEAELARRLAAELPRLGVKRAYLGLLTGAARDRLQPCLQLDGSGVRLSGPSHPVRQLLPQGFLAAAAPSTWLVGAVNFGAQVTGLWACDGGTDVLVFEQLRTEIGAVLQLWALHRALALELSGVPAPRLVAALHSMPSEPQEVAAGPNAGADEVEEPTRSFRPEPCPGPAPEGTRDPH